METDLITAVGRRQPQMLEMIRQLVSLESPTEDRAAVNRCVSAVEGWIEASGGKSQRRKQSQPATCWWAASARHPAGPSR